MSEDEIAKIIMISKESKTNPIATKFFEGYYL